MEWIYKSISLAAIVTAVGFLIKHLIQKKIDSYFNKELEKYKQELAVITENAKYDISKKLFDFEAYASKKHQVYPELYRLIFEPWKELSRFRVRFDLDIRNSKKDLDEDELAALFYKKLNAIAKKYNDAFDYFRKNELYLSKNTARVYEESLHVQSHFIRKITNTFDKNLENGNWQDYSFNLIDLDFYDEDFERADNSIEILKETIRDELSYTHSEEMTEKEEGLSL